MAIESRRQKIQQKRKAIKPKTFRSRVITLVGMSLFLGFAVFAIVQLFFGYLIGATAGIVMIEINIGSAIGKLLEDRKLVVKKDE